MSGMGLSFGSGVAGWLFGNGDIVTFDRRNLSCVSFYFEKICF
jgi:hypothetical protein